jgi:Na+/proline symporter
VAALALKVVTPWDFDACIIVIGLFAITWTLMGGMRTVIWTDVMQFGLFTIGGLTALLWIITSLDNGFATFLEVGANVPEAGGNGKFTLLNFTTDPAVGFTLWVGIIAAPFLNLSAFGVDQLNAQRMFCCQNESHARKAIIWSSVGQLLTLLMLLVGAALFVYYRENPPTGALKALFEKDHDFIFPGWITTTMPTGLRGLILAGIFAAAISSLDSILAALSQTTLALFHTPGDDVSEDQHRKMMFVSRGLVVFWGITLSGFAILLNQLRGDINMVDLAFGMIAYTTGPMLGLFLAAYLREFLAISVRGLFIGVIVSFLAVLCIRTDLYNILLNLEFVSVEQLASFDWLPVRVDSETGKVAGKLHYAWMWPITTLLTLSAGVLFPGRAQDPDAL